MLTYGWAIVVVVASMAALWYYGIVDVQSLFVRETCDMDIGFSCLDHSIVFVPRPAPFLSDKNELHLVLKNNLGDKYYINRVEMLDDFHIGRDMSGSGVLILSGYDNKDNPLIVNDITGSFETFGVNPTLSVGTKYEKDILIIATNDESHLQHTFKGHISGKVNKN